MKRVAVTGASGFVGSALVRRLAREDGLVVRTLSRRGADVPGGQETASCPPLETATPSDWRSGLAEVDVVVHLAARLPLHGANWKTADYENFARVNCRGAVALAEGLARAGGQRFVFASTIGVNGAISGDHPFAPHDPPAPRGNYARSKAEAEAALRTIAADLGVELAIIRAPVVYGPGVGGTFGRLVRAVRRYPVLPLGGLDQNAIDMIGLTNLTDFLATVSTYAREAGGTFLVSDSEPLSTGAIVGKIAAAYGVSPKLLKVPRFCLDAMRPFPRISRIVSRIADNLLIDDSAARSRFRWMPRMSVDDELQCMAREDLR